MDDRCWLVRVTRCRPFACDPLMNGSRMPVTVTMVADAMVFRTRVVTRRMYHPYNFV